MSHEDATHGPAPLGAVDPAPMHAAVDALAAALHEYVETAVGVRAEFGASEADEDPRVLALENRVGALNARLFDELHGALGIHADLTSSVWDPQDEAAVDDEDASPADVHDDTFTLDYVVMTRPGGPDLDDVLGLLDRWGHEARERLVDAGYAVPEWGVGRGEDDHEHEEDDE
ncbi:hypothetical protein [Cellulosimicrobium protaetiae]|uniref:Uncharacterized protein n=1 Tax=Cellulosimicrobium protaetiae TaxID=2587808 RepID=A0A6M5UFG1_9MICO|nr:hypothetical protein [Cellulosimicrobium protaetiae]QJW37266.1 hypothetical protein FIC82_014835 [Cellulosimicrobium protaetiae]